LARNDDVVLSVLGLGTGLALFYRGFRDLQLRRFIDGLATSKARSMAMGTVELSGTAELAHPLTDPIYGRPCAYYRIVVREQHGSGKRRRWVTIYEKDSSQHPFLLVDETGKVPVYPARAATYFRHAIDTTSSWLGSLFSEVDPMVARFLGGLSAGRGAPLHITADFLRPDDPVYVAGYAVPADQPFTWTENALRGAKLSLAQLSKRLKSDAARMKALDADNDGQIDAAEWDAGLARYRAELESAQPAAEAASGVIVRASPEGFLLLADRNEKVLIEELGQTAAWKIFGGPALTIGCSLYLFFRFFQ
jgi:hypothetical protein